MTHKKTCDNWRLPRRIRYIVDVSMKEHTAVLWPNCSHAFSGG